MPSWPPRGWPTQSTTAGRVYTISKDPVEEESVYQTDWVLDILEVGAVLKPSLFLMEPEVDMACSQLQDWQTPKLTL